MIGPCLRKITKLPINSRPWIRAINSSRPSPFAIRNQANGSDFRRAPWLSGAKAALLRYNAFSRLTTALVNILLGIPLIFFYDDFAALIPAELAQKALATFPTFGSLLGITLKPGKSAVGPEVTRLGLRGWFSSASNEYTLHIALPDGKRTARSALLGDYIDRRSTPTQELGNLIGRLSFSKTLLFGKFVRTQLRPLYQTQQRRAYNARLSAGELSVFRRRKEIIAAIEPRICRPCSNA